MAPTPRPQRGYELRIHVVDSDGIEWPDQTSLAAEPLYQHFETVWGISLKRPPDIPNQNWAWEVRCL